MRAALLSALSAIIHLPGLLIGPSLDAAVFAVVGWRMTAGDVPYADIWDHKPPGIYVINAAAALIGAELQWLVVWVLSVTAVAVVGMAGTSILERFVDRRIAIAVGAVAVIVAGQYLLGLGGGLTETFAAAFAAIAWWMVLFQAAPTAWVGAGVLLGAAVVTSPLAAPAAVALPFLAQPGSRIRCTALAAGAAGAVVAVVVLVLWAVGGLPAAIDAVVRYNAAYVAAAAGTGRWAVVPWTVLATLPLLALALVGAARARAYAGMHTAAWACGAWLLAAMLQFTVQGRFYAHYAIPLVVPLMLLAGIGVHDLLRRLRPWTFALVIAPLTGIGILAGIVGGWQEAVVWHRSAERVTEVGRAVRAVNVKAESILVWGNEPWLYRVADSPPATRFPYLFPLTTPGYGTQELVDEVLRELVARPPAVIVDAGSAEPGAPGGPPLLIGRPVGTEGRDVDLLDPLREWVSDHYRLDSSDSGWPIYRLAEP